MDEKEKESWLRWINVQLSRLEERDVIEPEDKEMYLKAIMKGEETYSQRATWFNIDRANYGYNAQFTDEQGEGITEKLRTDLTQNMEITKETMYDGFAPQIYEAARQGKIIVFPDGVNYGNPKVMNDIKANSYVRKEDEPEAMDIMAERWKYAMTAWDTNKVWEKFGVDSDKSVHKTVKKPSKFMNVVDFIVDRVQGEGVYRNLKQDFKRHQEGSYIKYKKDYARELNKAILQEAPDEKNVEFITTYDGVISLSKDESTKRKQLQAFGVDPKSKDYYNDLRQKHQEMVLAGKSRSDIMADVEAKTGLKNYNTGFKVYEYDTFDKSREFLVRNFNQLPSTSERAYGVPEIDLRKGGVEGEL